MAKVFLSYAQADGEVVDKVSADLRNLGVDVWMDRQNLRVGQQWLPQIQTAIERADAILIFLSRSSIQSHWVQAEYQAAFAIQKRRGATRLIPILLEEVELPRFLASIQYVDFTRSYTEGMNRLRRALDTSSGPPVPEVVDAGLLAKEVAREIARIWGIEGQSIANLATPNDPRLVFVIMSFVDDMEPIFEGIKLACAAVNLDALRIKDVLGDYRITDRIIEMIRAARFVVADLTHERPNVYFELGYARGVGKTVITVARQGSAIHFDVKDWAYLPYIDSRTLERDLKKRLEYELSPPQRENETGN